MIIQSVQEYISLIEKLKDNYTYEHPILPNSTFGKQIHEPHFIFRGHSNHEKYSLIPGVFRWKKVSEGYLVGEFSQMEHNILNDFISEACRYISDVPVGDIAAWLEIAQHFGVPTRLLDFTENPLVALYFACAGSPQENASVWIINEPAYNKKFFSEFALVQTSKSQNAITQIISQEIIYQDYQQHVGNLQYIQWPWIYKPHHHAERMNLQSSVFMIWGANRQPLNAFLTNDDYMVENQPTNSERGIMCHVDILTEHKSKLLKQLDSLGINEKFVYPGIDGVGRYIREKYSSNK